MKFFWLMFNTVLILHCFSASAEEFPFYIIDDDYIYQDTTNGGRFIRPQKIREAMQAKDSRPADLDVEGNWGSVAFGTQASLRVAGQNFSNNEPIIATLIVRNVGDQEGNYSLRPDVAASIVVIGPKGNPLERIDVAKPKAPHLADAIEAVKPARIYFLNPGIQRKFEIDLKAHFDLSTPGRYTIYARPRVLNPAIKKYTEIQSGNAVMSITNTLPHK